MSVTAKLPVSEVTRVFLSICWRLVIATVVGLVLAKVALTTEVVSSRDSVIEMGYIVVGAVFLLTFMSRPLRNVELHYPDGRPETDSLIDFLYEDDKPPSKP